jgi:NAD+ kinase
MTPHRFGVLAHPNRPASAPLSRHIAEWLRQRGHPVWLYTSWTPGDVQPHLAETDMIVAIGGDGAMLHAGRASAGVEMAAYEASDSQSDRAGQTVPAAAHPVPVLGVNMGQLGFLTEIAPNEWETALESVLLGQYWVEARAMLHVEVRRADKLLFVTDALNDVVLEHAGSSRMVRVNTFVNQHWVTTYNADALIVATATGSTAYALAAGGPILPPAMRNVLLLPVAPHLSLDRAIVLPEGADVVLQLAADGNREPLHGAVVIDGAYLDDLHSGDVVMARVSERAVHFARLRERSYFYRSLLDRLEPRPRPTEPPMPAPI